MTSTTAATVNKAIVVERADRRGVPRLHRAVRRLQTERAQPVGRRRSPRPCSRARSAGTSSTGPRTARSATGLGCSPTNHRREWCSAGTSARHGKSSRTPTTPVKSRSGSPPTAPRAPGSSSNTATSTVTGPAGKVYARASTVMPVGPCTSSALRPSCNRPPHHRQAPRRDPLLPSWLRSLAQVARGCRRGQGGQGINGQRRAAPLPGAVVSVNLANMGGPMMGGARWAARFGSSRTAPTPPPAPAWLRAANTGSLHDGEAGFIEIAADYASHPISARQAW